MESQPKLDGLTKKQLIEWLQANASYAFLLQHGLQGKVDNVAGKKNRNDLVKACKMVQQNPSFARQESDEKEAKEFEDTFRRKKVRTLRSLKMLCMRFILPRMARFAAKMHKTMPNVCVCMDMGVV